MTLGALGPPVPPSRAGLLAWAREALRLAGKGAPSRRLGQHFVVDPSVVAAFLRELEAWRGSDMAEVGAGPGTLAFYASPLAGRLRACEIDPGLASVAAAVVPGNVLVTIEDGLAVAGYAVEPVLFSNTPYSISSQLVAAAARNNRVKVLVLMVQREVALRLTARPGGASYGRLTVLASRFFEARMAGLFGRRSFYPPPDVDSALVVLVRRRAWEPGLDDAVEELARCLFTQRNRLAVRVAERCLGHGVGGRLAARLGRRRVRDLTHEDLEALAVEGGVYTSRRRTQS